MNTKNKTTFLSAGKKNTKHQFGFTLVETFIAIGILTVIAVTAVLILNPVQLLDQNRDSNRLNDIKVLNNAIKISKVNESMTESTESQRVYISLPDMSVPKDGLCDEYTLPNLASGWQYRCVSSGTNLRNIDGSGWLPINFFGCSISS